MHRGENVGRIVSYLKGALLLLANCSFLPTDTAGLLNVPLCSAECSKFTDFMKATYFQYRCKLQTLDPMELLTIAEAEYRMIYRNGKWTAEKDNPGSTFYGGQMKKKVVAVTEKKYLVVLDIVEEDVKVVVMVDEVVILVEVVEDYLTSIATTVVSGKFSNVSVDRPEKECTGSLIKAAWMVTNKSPALTTYCCTVLPDQLSHEKAL